MRTLYANISPLTNAYTNFYHLFFLHQQQAQRIFLCVWDLYFYEDKRFLPNDGSKEQLLREYVRNLEKVLQYLGADYKLVYLSDARNRFFARTDLQQLFQKILASITFRDLERRADFPYSLFQDTTLSRMQYLILDFLVATHFHELFPECARAKPTRYVTSQQFRIFHDPVTDALSRNWRQTPTPRVTWVKDLPVLVDDQGRIPGFDMPSSTVHRIIREHAEREPFSKRMLEDFEKVFQATGMELPTGWKAEVRKEGVDAFLPHFDRYLARLRQIIFEGRAADTPASLYVEDAKTFDRQVKPLNTTKLRILSLCDGSRTSYEIARALQLKPVTVSVYFGRLREMGLLSEGRRPKRKVANLVVDLATMR